MNTCSGRLSLRHRLQKLQTHAIGSRPGCSRRRVLQNKYCGVERALSEAILTLMLRAITEPVVCSRKM